MQVVKLIENETERRGAMKEIEKLWEAKVGTPAADRLKLLVTLSRSWPSTVLA